MTASTTSRRTVACALAGLALAASACGSTTTDRPRTTAEAPAEQATPKVPATPSIDVTPMLMRTGEEPGFRPGAEPGAMPRTVQTLDGVEAIAQEFRLPKEEVERLRDEGFQTFIGGPIRGPQHSAGLTNVSLYETAEGALHSRNHDLEPNVIRGQGPVKGLRFFSVPGVPGARGWSATEPPVANVLWVQGRCYMTLGNQGPGDLAAKLTAGVRAIYARTQGRCGDEEKASVAPALWMAPQDALQRTLAAGLVAEPKEHLKFHVHAHLDVFIDGEPIVVPAGIGINVADPEVKPFDEPDGTTSYGGIERCGRPCISPLHTHDATGILHTESARTKPNTLGQFFTEWGVRLTPSCVARHCAPERIAVYVDGKRTRQDPRAIALKDRREIAIVIGKPPAKVPATADFSMA